MSTIEMNRLFAVIGNPIDHSLSPLIHTLFAKQIGIDLSYQTIEMDLNHFEQQVRDFFCAGGAGLNVTLPGKQRAFAMSDVATARCLKAKAANTLWHDGSKLYADNTDGIGLLRDLTRYTSLSNKRILLLGAGGAARGVLTPLLEAKPASLTITNRTTAKADTLSQEFPPSVSINLNDLDSRSFDLIINATCANNLALSTSIMTPNTQCFDLNYQQQGTTPFVKWAKEQGFIAVDGLGMLIEQAAEAFYIWHKIFPNTTLVRQYLIPNTSKRLIKL